MMNSTDDLKIDSVKPLISPSLLMAQLPINALAAETIISARKQAQDIIAKKDKRLLVIVGPCSIHDTKAALEYGEKLKTLITQHQNELCIIMRVYFEKPRTTRGWKGLINDPHLDNSFDINHGLHEARKLLLDLNQKNIPCGSEFLDTIIPQFISDLISWGAIGARTTESQVHRELASGLSMPVGFKNGTDGNIQIAIDAINSSHHPHHFLSVTKSGLAAIVQTKGNQDTHIILRGSSHGTNFDEAHIQATSLDLEKHGLNASIMIDCSHGNSQKDHRNQAKVVQDIAKQIANGSENITGVMIESHLTAGKQALTDKNSLVYGQSITDACIDWDETVDLLNNLANSVKTRNQTKGILS